MQQIETFADDRITGVCLYCGGPPVTREHVPSRVLLDRPYSENLPVVAACQPCNNGFSLDEEYVACVVECALHGSAEPNSLARSKIKRLLAERPALAARISAAMTSVDGTMTLAVEEPRIRRILVKLARGHAMFELATSLYREPTTVDFLPLHLITPEHRNRFEERVESDLWPEVGSRKLVAVAAHSEPHNDWMVVQDERYRYLAAVTRGGVVVRMVLSEYLAAELWWND